jgi:hypothetical protein
VEQRISFRSATFLSLVERNVARRDVCHSNAPSIKGSQVTMLVRGHMPDECAVPV